jgi:hypothetical protein
MGSRRRRQARDQSPLDEAADVAVRAYEGRARSQGVHVAATVIIGTDSEGKANITVSCDPELDPAEVVKAAVHAYFAAEGRTIHLLDSTPRR